ncbi:MAG: hypothetical protein HC884_08240 [Chloroflexaceae bacterium]|nr:hypothetical protein [Chloroflexaceae bacterium]
MPGLLDIPGVPSPLVAHLYELAAAYYHLEPWRWLYGEHQFEVRYPPDGPSRYVVVLGQPGQFHGLAVCDSLDDLSRVSMLPPEEQSRLLDHFLLFFGEAVETPAGDLEEIAHSGQTMPLHGTFPRFQRKDGEQGPVLPTGEDVSWAEGALAAMVAYVRALKSHPGGGIHPVEMIVPVRVIRGDTEVYIRMPVLP